MNVYIDLARILSTPESKPSLGILCVGISQLCKQSDWINCVRFHVLFRSNFKRVQLIVVQYCSRAFIGYHVHV